MGSPAGSGAAQPGPKVSKFEDESDGWSTAANATPSKSELQTSGWGEAGATTTGGWGAVNGKPGSKWIDEITEPSSTKPWPLAETKEQTGAWPSPAADATPKTSNEGATWPKSAPSARSDIESWRAGVEDHRPVTSACPDDEPWRAGSDAVRSEEWTSASAIPVGTCAAHTSRSFLFEYTCACVRMCPLYYGVLHTHCTMWCPLSSECRLAKINLLHGKLSTGMLNFRLFFLPPHPCTLLDKLIH